MTGNNDCANGDSDDSDDDDRSVSEEMVFTLCQMFAMAHALF